MNCMTAANLASEASVGDLHAKTFDWLKANGNRRVNPYGFSGTNAPDKDMVTYETSLSEEEVALVAPAAARLLSLLGGMTLELSAQTVLDNGKEQDDRRRTHIRIQDPGSETHVVARWMIDYKPGGAHIFTEHEGAYQGGLPEIECDELHMVIDALPAHWPAIQARRAEAAA
jgi:hypothetical protein